MCTRDWHVATAEARHVALLASWSGTRVSGAPGGGNNTLLIIGKQESTLK